MRSVAVVIKKETEARRRFKEWRAEKKGKKVCSVELFSHGAFFLLYCYL